jgi:DNA-binding CsgD family transcriptional regulator/tetratricopeptide (TPR) repeat protein
VANSPADLSRHAWLESRLADSLHRVGDTAGAEEVASRALDHMVDPDLFVDLHRTLMQCRMMAGESTKCLATLEGALASPGLSARHQARLLVLAARTHSHFGDFEKAGRVATDALAAAEEADDNWAMGWALHVLTLVTSGQGRMTDALPLFDRALAVTQTDSALTDLRLLLQINKAVTLGDLDRYQEALTVARQARRLADHVGSGIRLAQAHGALGQLLFEMGQWDDALAEVETLQDDLKEPVAACCDLGIAALISLHQGEAAAARRHLVAAVPHAERIGNRLVGSLALARSLDREYEGDLAEALAALIAGPGEKSEDVEEMEDRLPDAVRLAMGTGAMVTVQKLTDQAIELAQGSDVPHRQANALYCRALRDQDAHGMLAAAERYEDAGRPLLKAKALESAAGVFVEAVELTQARAAFTRAVEAYASLGAAEDMARLQARFRAHGIRRGPRAKHRSAQTGWDSLTPTETKIAAFVEEGLSNPEIAARMMLSRRTVATHVSHILKKLDVHSRTDIAREAALRTIKR